MTEKQPEEQIDKLTFISHIFNVMDKDKIPSRVSVNSLGFLVGGTMFMKEDPGYYESLEDAVAECAIQVVDSIAKDFIILEIIQEP